MGVFAIQFTASTSASGEIITIEDNSNWSDNTEGYSRTDFVRTFLLTDYAGTVLDTIELPDDSDTATYEITKPMWVNILFSIVGAETFTKLESYPFDRIYVNLLQDALLSSSCCGSNASQNTLNTSTSFWQGALGIEATGNSSQWQSDMDTAMTFITQI